jgi:hypothetical protein
MKRAGRAVARARRSRTPGTAAALARRSARDTRLPSTRALPAPPPTPPPLVRLLCAPPEGTGGWEGGSGERAQAGMMRPRRRHTCLPATTRAGRAGTSPPRVWKRARARRECGRGHEPADSVEEGASPPTVWKRARSAALEEERAIALRATWSCGRRVAMCDESVVGCERSSWRSGPMWAVSCMAAPLCRCAAAPLSPRSPFRLPRLSRASRREAHSPPSRMRFVAVRLERTTPMWRLAPHPPEILLRDKTRA